MRKALLVMLAPLGAIYWRVAPENAKYPFCVLTSVSEVPTQDELNATAETEFVFDLDIYARNAAEAEAKKEAAFSLLNRPGELFELGTWHVGYCRIEAVWDNSELEMQGSERNIVRYTLEFKIRAIRE